MSARTKIGGGFEIEDVGGSFRRFLNETPRIARAYLADAVKKTAFALQSRMEADAPVGPDAPHIKESITYTTRGQSAQVGYIDATEAAGPGNDASLADVALFNEYSPNHQPFMRPAAEAEASDFVRRITAAVQQVERDLSGGGGLT